MSPPIAYALAALVLHGAYNLAFKQAHQKPLHEPTYLVVQTAAVFTTLAAMGTVGLGFAITPIMAGLGVVGGLLGYLTGWSLLYAIGRGPPSVTAAFRNLSFVVTAALSVAFLQEQLSPQRLMAMAVAAFSIFIMSRGGDVTGRPHPVIFLTLLVAGAMAFVHKIAAVAGVSASAFLMCQSATAHVGAHIVCSTRQGYQWSARLVRFALVTGAMIAANMTLGLYALRGADAVVIAPILQLGFLVTAPGSFWLFREPITRNKLLGLALGATAIVLFGTAVT